MSDVVHLIYNSENIDNGGIRVGAPKGLGVEAVTGSVATNYEIDTYSSVLPTTGTVYNKYTERFDDYQFYTA